MIQRLLPLCIAAAAVGVGAAEPPADVVVRDAKIVTVDGASSVRSAMAIRDGRIAAVGSFQDTAAHIGPNTRFVAMQGRTVLPGLIDSHVHPTGASMIEHDHPIPQMESVADVLRYIRGRSDELPGGAWIQVRQVFITRLREQRYPTRRELDAAAPGHPVIFSTGPDASLNTLALEQSGIDRNFRVTDGGPGFAEKDPATGEPTGIIRGCTRYVKVKATTRPASDDEQNSRLLALFKDYNENGFTSILDRDASPAALKRYQGLRERRRLTLRIGASHHLDTIGPLPEIEGKIQEIAKHPLNAPDPFLQLVGVKAYLDGGMLTGSAYMREPWGVSRIYGITDPAYRGVLFIPNDRLTSIVETTVKTGLAFTAHSVGDGAVHALLDAYEAVNARIPVRPTRSTITHSNFMSAEAIKRCAALGVPVDIQPAWLYLDTHTLVQQFGYDRLRYFQPLRSLFAAGAIAGGGSDHMQKIGALRSINPYHPFLAMWVALTRKSRSFDRPLHPEEALTREQAIRFYTLNNAHILRREKELGSLEPGKLADFIVLDRDILTCPVDDVKETRVLSTYVGGSLVSGKE